MYTNIHILHLECVLHVNHVTGDKSVLADAGRPLEDVAVVLSDERGPVGVVGAVEVDGEEAVVGRTPVGPEYGTRARGRDVLEVVLELEDDLREGELALDGAPVLLEVAEVDQVSVAALLREHEQVPPAVGDLTVTEENDVDYRRLSISQ